MVFFSSLGRTVSNVVRTVSDTISGIGGSGIGGRLLRTGLKLGAKYLVKKITEPKPPKQPKQISAPKTPTPGPGGGANPNETTRPDTKRPAPAIAIDSGRWILGETRTGGSLKFYEQVDRDFWMAFYLSEGPCESIEAIWVDGESVPFTRSGNRLVATGEYAGRLELYENFAADGSQGAAIRAACSNFTEEHKWEHVSWVAVKLNQPNWSDDDENRFWDKIPEIEYLIKGIKFTWPGQDTALWTNNVTALRYWLETVRAEVPATAIDRATFDQSLAVSAVEITPTGTIPAGYTRTFPRYTFDMVITADMPLDDIRTEMDFCAQGEVADLGGVLYFYTGTDRTVRYNLDEDDLISIDTIQTGPALQDRINAASMSIDQSVDHDYAEFDVAEIVDQASLDRDGGHKLTQYLGSRPGIKHPVKAMWLLTVALRQARNSMRVAATLFPGFDGNPYAYFALIPGEWVTLSVDEYGFDQKLFQVYSKQINENGSVSLILEEQSRNNFAETIGALPALPRNINIPNRRNVPAVSSFRCAAVANTSEDGTIIISILTRWLNSPFTTHVEMRRRGQSAVETATSVTNNTAFASVVAGQTYELRARHANHAGYFGAWTAWIPCEVTGDLTPPADPVGVVCEGLLGGFTVNWTPPTDNDYGHTEIHSGAPGSDFDAATFLDNESSTRYTRFGYATITQLKLWLVHVDRSGNRGRPVSCDVTTLVEGADTTPPAAATGVDCGPLPNTSTLSNGFTVNWDYPPESDYDYTEIWRSPAGGIFAQAVIMDRVQGTQYNRFGFALATALRIWVVHVDRSGNRSREVSCDVTTGGDEDDEGGDLSLDIFDIRSPDTLTSGLTDPNAEIKTGGAWQFQVGSGLTAPFWLRLKRNVPLTVTITLPQMVRIHTSDYTTTDVITFSQQTFTFDSSNWDVFQRFTISAANGSIFLVSGNIDVTIDVAGDNGQTLATTGQIQVPQSNAGFVRAPQTPRWIRVSSYGRGSITLNTGRNQNGGIPATYRWLYNAGTAPVAGISGTEVTSTTPEVTISGLRPNTLYFFIVRAENSQGSSRYTDPASFSTTSGASFVLSVEAGADRSEFPNTLIMLSASARISGRTTDPTTFRWRIVSGSGGRLIAENTATPSFSGTRGSYVLEVTATNGSVTATDRLTVRIAQTSLTNLSINARAASGNDYFTTNDRVLLTAAFTLNNQLGDPFYRWSGSPIPPVNAQSPEAYFDVPQGAGQNMVRVMVDNNGAEAVVNRVVDYVDTSFPEESLPDLQFDPGSVVTLEGPTPRFPLGDTVYTWRQTRGPRVVLANANTRRPTFTAPASTTILTFQVSAVNNGVTSRTYTFNVPINATRVSVVVRVANLGDNRYQFVADATVVNPVGATTYAWQGGAAISNTRIPNPIVTLVNDNPVSITVTVTNAGIRATHTEQIPVVYPTLAVAATFDRRVAHVASLGGVLYGCGDGAFVNGVRDDDFFTIDVATGRTTLISSFSTTFVSDRIIADLFEHNGNLYISYGRGGSRFSLAGVGQVNPTTGAVTSVTGSGGVGIAPESLASHDGILYAAQEATSRRLHLFTATLSPLAFTGITSNLLEPDGARFEQMTWHDGTLYGLYSTGGTPGNQPLRVISPTTGTVTPTTATTESLGASGRLVDIISHNGTLYAVEQQGNVYRLLQILGATVPTPIIAIEITSVRVNNRGARTNPADTVPVYPVRTLRPFFTTAPIQVEFTLVNGFGNTTITVRDGSGNVLDTTIVAAGVRRTETGEVTLPTAGNQLNYELEVENSGVRVRFPFAILRLS